MRILLTSPLRQKAHILAAHRASVRALRLPEGVTIDSWYIVNDCPEGEALLREEGVPFITCNTGDSYETGEGDHLWTAANLMKMHDLRNACLYYAMASGYDAVLSADTDLVLHPDTVTWLLAADKPIVAEVFWTVAESGVEWANAWMCDQSSVSAGDLLKWKKPGLYEVGGTGALILIKSEAIRNGVDYTKIPCIDRAIAGEDRHFAIRAQCAGYGLWIDTHAPATHLYTEDCYREWIKCLTK